MSVKWDRRDKCVPEPPEPPEPEIKVSLHMGKGVSVNVTDLRLRRLENKTAAVAKDVALAEHAAQQACRLAAAQDARIKALTVSIILVSVVFFALLIESWWL